MLLLATRLLSPYVVYNDVWGWHHWGTIPCCGIDFHKYKKNVRVWYREGSNLARGSSGIGYLKVKWGDGVWFDFQNVEFIHCGPIDLPWDTKNYTQIMRDWGTGGYQFNLFFVYEEGSDFPQLPSKEGCECYPPHDNSADWCLKR